MRKKTNPLWKISFILLTALTLLGIAFLLLHASEIAKGGYMAGFGTGMLIYFFSPILVIICVADLIAVYFFIKLYRLKVVIGILIYAVVLILLSPLLYVTIPNLNYYIQEKIAFIPLSREQAITLINDCRITNIERTSDQTRLGLKTNPGDYSSRYTAGSNFDDLRIIAYTTYKHCGEILIRDNTLTQEDYESIPHGYNKKDNFVFYYSDFLGEADSKTFVSFDKEYAKDATHVFFQGKVLINADPDTFNPLRENYAKDSKYVYYGNDSIQNADPNTFVTVGTGYAKDANHAYIGKNIIMSVVDPKTFTHIGGHYSKDAINGYYLADFFRVIPNIDTATFTAIGDGIAYAKDTNHVYHGSFIIQNAEPNTFELIGYMKSKIYDTSSVYGKDTKHVYRGSEIVTNADPTKCTTQNLIACQGE